jgi:periplasmic copper chaperone A
LKRLALLTVLAFAALVALAASASAHVTVTAPGATRGGSDQQITFRVPVEEDKNTTSVTVALPLDTPIASVDVVPVSGWTHTEKTSKLAKPIKTDDGDITSAVSQITWTATDGGLKPGEVGLFTIVAGQLPDAPSLVFKALQTYADGTVVRWIETPAPGSTAEPENPAPTLALAKGSGSAAAADPAPATSSSSSNTGPIVLSIVALVLAAGALGLAFVTRAQNWARS